MMHLLRQSRASWLSALFGAGILTLAVPAIGYAQRPQTERTPRTAPTQPSSTGEQPVAGSPADTSGPTTAKGANDTKFMKEAADGGMAEVELGEMATAKASSSDVRQFGQRMVSDHTKANDQLKQIATNKGITLPSEPSAKNKATKERLSKLSGDAFDRAYMADMVKDHKKDVAEFKRESNSSTDSELKQFASQTLPTLEDHLKEAKTVNDKVGGTIDSNPVSTPSGESPHK